MFIIMFKITLFSYMALWTGTNNNPRKSVASVKIRVLFSFQIFTFASNKFFSISFNRNESRNQEICDTATFNFADPSGHPVFFMRNEPSFLP